jgi:hypothetical protein
MRNHKLLTITGTMAVSFLSGWLPAIAAPDLTYNGASRYKDAVGGSTYTRATMSLTSSSTFSSCKNPAYIALPADKLYMIDWATYVYKTSALNLKKLVTEVPTIVSKNIAVNTCGFAVIPTLNMANGYSAGDKVTINGSTPYNVMTLPLSPEAPTCKNGVTYLVSP